MVAKVGVLALQGDFARHQAVLAALGCQVRTVRYPDDLHGLDALILPGGESATISKQLDFSNLRKAVGKFARTKPVLGTCAGLILMSREPGDQRVQGLGLLDVAVTRNSWGRQVHSFSTSVDVRFNGKAEPFPAIFIRAPRMQKMGPGVEVLAQIEGEPVLVQQGRHMGATFHPELTSDHRIHELFLKGVSA